jgi:two-component system, OmpR family, manganese sensing sensor histidine kinase
MFQATRQRLALWYTTVTAILLLTFASGFYFYVRTTLIERIDDTLSHVAEVVQRSLVIQPADRGQIRVNVEESFRDNAIALEDDHIDLEWFSPTGTVLWSTFAEPLSAPMHFNPKGETIRISETQALRQITERVQIGRQVLGYLRVSHPWFEVTKPTRQLIWDLLLGTTLLIGIVGAIGWFLSGLAMQPIRESYQRLKQFTADASHELRNPIAVIQTNVQVALADPDPDPESQRNHLQVVERLTRRLGKLVDDLLFLARQDSGIIQSQRQAIALEKLLAEVAEEQSAIATEKQVFLELQIEHLEIQCDRDQISRLFTNLISNAVQYTPTQGKIQLELKRVGASAQIKVIDSGIGIPEESLSKLFDRFYRVDPARTKTTGGSGLGLAIAQAIVENHQGQIQIESQLRQGTTVTVTLPAIEDSSRS